MTGWWCDFLFLFGVGGAWMLKVMGFLRLFFDIFCGVFLFDVNKWTCLGIHGEEKILVNHLYELICY